MHVSRKDFHLLTLLSAVIVLSAVPLTVKQVNRVQFKQSSAASNLPKTQLNTHELNQIQFFQNKSQKSTVNATGDATIYKTGPFENDSRGELLLVGGASGAESIIQFDLAKFNLSLIDNVKLRLKIYSNTTSAVTVSGAEPFWNEYQVNFETKPSVTSELSSFSNIGKDNWVELDITEYVQNQQSGFVSLTLQSNSASTLELYSRESGFSSPKLIITTVSE